MSEHALDAYEQQQDEEEAMRDRELQERHEEAQIIDSIPRRWTEETQHELFIEDAAMRRVNQ